MGQRTFWTERAAGAEASGQEGAGVFEEQEFSAVSRELGRRAAEGPEGRQGRFMRIWEAKMPRAI